uniref:SSD domain-containing protein n=1 Tax=Ascaris lumbricoides TaxID=6252 RepID=A0A0M3HWA4_ASCLU
MCVPTITEAGVAKFVSRALHSNNVQDDPSTRSYSVVTSAVFSSACLTAILLPGDSPIADFFVMSYCAFLIILYNGLMRINASIRFECAYKEMDNRELSCRRRCSHVGVVERCGDDVGGALHCTSAVPQIGLPNKGPIIPSWQRDGEVSPGIEGC